jgi:Kae1-associated kinase Bud32
VNKNKIIYRGAEAEIHLSKFLGYDIIEKKRIKKSYRIKTIDERLISSRTKEEAKLITEARKHGVSVPIIYDIDMQEGTIKMEYLKGNRIKDILNDISEEDRKNLCLKIGESIAKLHNNNIIHGDITTSNMILMDKRINFIDFGLGEKNSDIETKGVDLHVLMEAIESTHSKYGNCFGYVLEGYKKYLKTGADLVIKQIYKIVKRGRYR